MKKRKIMWNRVAIMAVTPVLIATAGVKMMTKEIQEPKQNVSETPTNVCENKESFDKPYISESGYESLGTFKVTYYCGGACCNGEKYAGWSASNQRLEIGMCAADPSIPFGTELYLSGGVNGLMECYTVADRGSAITGNHIDIYCESHELAKQLGVVYTEVFVKK